MPDVDQIIRTTFETGLDSGDEFREEMVNCPIRQILIQKCIARMVEVGSFADLKPTIGALFSIAFESGRAFEQARQLEELERIST